MHIHDLPADIQYFCANGTWQEITVGRSGDQVFRIVHPQRPTYYLKIAMHPFEQELLAEKERLQWLQGRLPVPSVVASSTNNQHTYLLISEIPGLMSCDERFAQDIPIVVRLLAEGLRLLHQVNITACPFDQRLIRKVALARQRVEAGLVDISNFDGERKGARVSELFKQLIETKPNAEDIVFTHGDYCLPNILIDPINMQLSGFIDVGRAGVADRYQDLALAARSLTSNFGPGWEPLLWKAYGLEIVDVAKIAFYQLLDEFF